MLVMIDNYDSFTFNLVQMFQTLGQPVHVVRNDLLTVEGLARLNPTALVISPGPRGPNEAGISVAAIRRFGGTIPILGVCLGHQSIAFAYGADVVRADRLMHGKTSVIFHKNAHLFRGLPQPFEGVRYHSLLVAPTSLPPCLEVTAWTAEGEIMGIRHRGYNVEGVQFHPESILAIKEGYLIIENFIRNGRESK
jgi:anthranilate synthase/aminodeoxychorismate synthase-like glutamine amidotransferase